MWYSSASTLAGHRWYGCVSRVLDITITGVLASGRIYNYQTTQTASTTAGMTSLTIAHLINGMYQITQTAVVTLPLPTGTLTRAGILGGSASNMNMDQSIDWSLINTGSSLGSATVQINTAHTRIGSGLVAIGTRGRFRTRLSATNVAITYRIS